MMKQKLNRIVGTVVAVSLLSATPVWAKPIERHAGNGREVQSISIKKIPSDMTKALQDVYKLIPELKDLRVSSADIWEDEDGTSEWSFTLRNKEQKENTSMVRVNLTIDPDTGKLLYYSIFNSDWNPTKQISEKEAKEIADKFLKKAVDKSDRYQLVKVSSQTDDDDEYVDEEGEGAQQREFIYQLTVNKIPVQGTDVRIKIDGDGHLTRYNNYFNALPDESLFPDAKKALSKKKAEAAYLDLLDMQLVYNANQLLEVNDGEEATGLGAVLKYVPSFSGAIDAVTGKKAYEYTVDDEGGSEQIPYEKIKLSPQGKDIFIKSTEDAQKVLEEAIGIDLSQADYNESGNKQSRSYRFYTDDEKGGSVARVTIDAKTGQLQVIDYRSYDDSTGTGFKKEEAKAAAVKKLEQWLGKDVTEVFLTGGWAEPEFYSFQFNPSYQGIPVESSENEVEFDGKGNLTRLRIVLQNDFSKLPDSGKAISAETAGKTYLKKNALKLTYVLQGVDGETNTPNVGLYYVPTYEDREAYVDAITGKFQTLWE
ncbi:YcdB/YcdC domain-containing protein [Brevibacillus fluminis]|uniref:YcdB/YcdC domain-containing protein n=1 Tax=Brevibacillus fluminis TaxID=511487 RepID=UPI003F88F060